MNRRKALKNTSLILGSALLSPAILSTLQSCQQNVSATRELAVLSKKQDDLVRLIADTIIPRTETVGAADVMVNQFIDLLLEGTFDEKEKQQFLDGLSKFDSDCQSTTGKKFVKLNPDERYNYLNNIDAEIMGKTYEEEVPFYYTFKQLVVTIYFSSKAGVVQNLNYLPIPGPYIANIEFKEGDKILIGNNLS